MARSIKKGPYVDAKLLARVEKMNAENKKEVLKTWSRASTIFPQMVGHTMTEENTFQYIYQMKWLVIN